MPRQHKVGHVEEPGLDWRFLLLFTIRREPHREADHFTLERLEVSTREQFVQSLLDHPTSSALVYVHGFATSFEEALFRLAQIEYDTKFNGIPIAFSWPSMGQVSQHAYFYDQDRK